MSLSQNEFYYLPHVRHLPLLDRVLGKDWVDVVSSRDHLGDYLSIKVFDNDDDLIELVLIDRRSIGNFLTNKVRDLQLFFVSFIRPGTNPFAGLRCSELHTQCGCWGSDNEQHYHFQCHLCWHLSLLGKPFWTNSAFFNIIQKAVDAPAPCLHLCCIFFWLTL